MDLGLKGKTVIVTGGASNIGRSIVLAFAKESSNIVIADIDDEQANKVVVEANSLGGHAICINTDIAMLDQVEKLVEKAIKHFGTVDVLVNNAGGDKVMPFVDTTPAIWDKLITLNFKGMIHCTKTVLAHMIERKRGVIVSVGSDAGRMGEFREAIYSGCKGAQIAFSKSVARETGRYGIRLNVVCPALTIPSGADEVGKLSVFSKRLDYYTEDKKEKASTKYPLRRLGTAGDIANAVVFLASDAANFITGQTLSVDGGYTMI